MATSTLPDAPPEETNNPGQDEYQQLTRRFGNPDEKDNQPVGNPTDPRGNDVAAGDESDPRSEPSSEDLANAEENPDQPVRHEKQVGRGYRKGQIQSKPFSFKSLLGRRKLLIFGGGGTLVAFAIIAILAILLPTLKIPQLAAEVEGYRLARLSRTFYNYASVMTNDEAAIEASTDVTTKELVGRTPLGKSLSLYKPLRVINNMKANDVMGFKYDNTGRLTHINFNLQNGASTSVAVPDYKISLNPKDLINNYKERLRFASQTKAALTQALDGSNFLTRSRVGRLLQSANGVHLYWWERAGLAFSGKNQQQADILEAQLTEQRVNQKPTQGLHTGALEDEAKEAEQAYDNCFTDPACTEDAINNDGIPTTVKDILSKVKIQGNTALNVLSPAYAIAFPVCISYDASKNVAQTVMNSQNSEAIRLFMGVASAADQQKKGDVTLEAVGALNRQAGNIADSIPGKLANGEPVDTSNENSPQAGPVGEYSLLNAFDSLIGGSGNNIKTKVANAITDKLCIVTNQNVAIGLAAMSAILFLIPGADAAESGMEAGATGIAKAIGQKILDKVTSKETFNAVRNTARDVGVSETATLGMSYVARMLVLSQLGAMVSGLDKTDFANQVDMGAAAYGNQMVQQETFGRPLTPTETSPVEKQDTAFLEQKSQSQSTYTHYFALSNPFSLTSRLALSASNWKLSDIPNWFVHFPHILSAIFSPLKLLGAHSLAASSNADYGMVQFGWSTDEENLINNDPTYDPIVNDQVVNDPANHANIIQIAKTYAKCFGYTTDDNGNLTYDSNYQIGDLLGAVNGNPPLIQRDDSGDVAESGGTCSPQNLSYNSPDPVARDSSLSSTQPNDLIFRWRLAQSYQNVLNDLSDAQNVSGASDG